MENKKNKSIVNEYRKNLIIVSVIVASSFLLLFIFFEYNRYTDDENNLKKRIYDDKAASLRNKVNAEAQAIAVFRDSLDERMRADLKILVNEAYDMASNIYYGNKDFLTEKQLKKVIVDAIEAPRFFNGRGYFFIMDFNGRNICNPFTTIPLGTDVSNVRNENGDFPIRRIIDGAKINRDFADKAKINHDNYVSYLWIYPGDKSGIAYEKTAYTRNLPFYNWIIGTGDYLKYVVDETKEKASKMINRLNSSTSSTFFLYDISGKGYIAHKSDTDSTYKVNSYDPYSPPPFKVLLDSSFIKNGRFFEHKWISKSKNTTNNHLSYLAYISDWNWIIGACEDVDTVRLLVDKRKASLTSELRFSFLVAFVLLVILALIIVLISMKLKKEASRGFNFFIDELQRAIKDEDNINLDYFEFKEYTKLAIATNKLLDLNNKNLEILNEREKELTISNKSKDRFFSIIAHDLKNPFNSLLGLLTILKEEYDSLSDEERKEYVEVLNRSSNNLYNLLLKLLQWARLQTTSMDYDPSVFETSELIYEEIAVLTGQAKDKNINIEFTNITDKLVFADRNMISTVVRNLLSNALKFTKKGGLITISTIFSENMILISIEDNGMGMDDDVVQKLFKIDEKISSVGTANETGTGLGLILCSEFVKLNKGEIFVSSVKGKGSVFSFTIPIP